MPAPSPELTVPAVEARARACFAPDAGDHLGLEVEWIVIDAADPARPVTADEVLAATTGPLPAGGTVTVEPGGQLELSTRHRRGAGPALQAVTVDELVLRQRCADAGLRMVSIGLDPLRPPRRTLERPRYRAMETVFRREGSGGMTMAASSASIQINVDAGADPLRTWRTAGLIGPVLLAMFANSPFHMGRPTGWKSTRQLCWWRVPGRRGEPVPTWSPEAWVDRVLDTDVLCIFDGDDACAAPPGLRFRDWMERGHPLGFPTAADLEHHLTTLFPPVRPRGWLELRMVDAVPERGLRVASALCHTLLCDADAGAEAATACLPVAGRWEHASRVGLADPELATAAARCLDIAADALGGDALADECRAWRREYADHGRCPADDLLCHPDPIDLPDLRSEVPLA